MMLFRANSIVWEAVKSIHGGGKFNLVVEDRKNLAPLECIPPKNVDTLPRFYEQSNWIPPPAPKKVGKNLIAPLQNGFGPILDHLWNLFVNILNNPLKIEEKE